MSAGLNRGRLDDGEYATFETPSDYPFMDTLLHDCFDHGGNPDANRYQEVLVEFNYGPHYDSTPGFSVTVNKCSRQPKRGHDAHGSYKTNLLVGGGFNVPGIPSIATQRTTEKTTLPQNAKDAIIEAIETFDPDPRILPGREGRGPVGDESDWDDHPFVDIDADERGVHRGGGDWYAARLWDTDSEGVCIHTTHCKLDVAEKTGLYVQGDGTPFTPVDQVVIDGDVWDCHAVAGAATEYLRTGTVAEITAGTAHITTDN